MLMRFRSLRVRIFVLTALPAALMLLGALIVAHRTAMPTVRRSIREALGNAGAVATRLTTMRRDELARMADVIVRDPRFFATFAVSREEQGAEFIATIEQIANEFLYITDADFLEVYIQNQRICRIDRGRGPLRNLPPVPTPVDVDAAAKSVATSGHGVDGVDVCAMATAPIRVFDEVAGALRLGRRLDQNFADEIQRLGTVELAVRDAGTTTLETSSGLGSILAPASQDGADGTFIGNVRDRDYLALTVPLDSIEPSHTIELLLARPLDVALAPIHGMERAMALLSAAGVLLTLGGGLFVARGVTGPLARVVHAAERLRKGQYDYPLEAGGDDEIHRLSRSFVEMRDALQQHVRRLREIDKIKSDFIALAGHELKTPLTIITGFNDLISDGSFGDIPPQVRETSEIIKQQLTRLNSQVENILEITRFEQGTAALNFEPVDLEPVIREAIARQAPLRKQRDVELLTRVSEEIPPVVCDRDRVLQALTLLLDNAVRFTPDGGKVTVVVEADDRGPRITVQDSGIGIAPSQLPWIFEKFYEGQDINRHSSGQLEFRSGGFGLGLALCKAILDAHGTRIEVRSALGEGSSFSFVLPAHQMALVGAGV